MDTSKAIKQIPFGKFFDINGEDKELINNLRLIKFEEVKPMEPDFLYLLEDIETGKHYCVHEPGSVGYDNARDNFIGDGYKGIKEIRPKNADWYQTHWIYELTK